MSGVRPGPRPGSEINSEKTPASVTPDTKSPDPGPGHIRGSNSAFYENTTCGRSTPVFLVRS